MKYKKLTGIILKKQNYKEADQIITLWTREAGKVRVMAKSLRLPKSKLCSSMQDLGLVEIDLAGRGNLMTLIGAKLIRQHSRLITSLAKASQGFYAAELIMKMTADEQPNESVFNLLTAFLEKIDQEHVDSLAHADEFALNVAEILGFGIPEKVSNHRDVVNFVEDILERELKSNAFLITT
jgi:DNA repair protein RecO (recombination protein O)